MKKLNTLTYVIVLLIFIACSSNDNDEPTPTVPTTGYLPVKITSISGTSTESIYNITYNIDNQIIGIAKTTNGTLYSTHNISYTNNLITQIELIDKNDATNRTNFSYTASGILNAFTNYNDEVYPVSYNANTNMYTLEKLSFYFNKNNVFTQTFYDGGFNYGIISNSANLGPFKNLSFQPVLHFSTELLFDFYFFNPVAIDIVNDGTNGSYTTVNEYNDKNNLVKVTYINSETNEVEREVSYTYQLREI